MVLTFEVEDGGANHPPLSSNNGLRIEASGNGICSLQTAASGSWVLRAWIENCTYHGS